MAGISPNCYTNSKRNTDQRRNMDVSLVRQLCDLLQIAKTRTTTNYPSSNGHVIVGPSYKRSGFPWEKSKLLGIPIYNSKYVPLGTCKHVSPQI